MSEVEKLDSSSVAESADQPCGLTETQHSAGEDAALSEAMAAVDRWLDREHHRFPSHPASTAVATIYCALAARLKAEGRL